MATISRMLEQVDSLEKRTEEMLATVKGMLDDMYPDTPNGRAARELDRQAYETRDKGDHEAADRLEAQADELLSRMS